MLGLGKGFEKPLERARARRVASATITNSAIWLHHFDPSFGVRSAAFAFRRNESSCLCRRVAAVFRRPREPSQKLRFVAAHLRGRPTPRAP
jgi:hypothetical protein